MTSDLSRPLSCTLKLSPEGCHETMEASSVDSI
eukprot:CAMPEP_0194273262 /NCGR_PEP_ID=MMETSP0169-20130528/6640_1 /TAXON_ID=218684 /ORGANISM="Corethron pennatum, Strain L29A3" /LENGTH=32 /DNA_ID= /DNA_START= /DNA_END= /DNA_ORIENTATION=